MSQSKLLTAIAVALSTSAYIVPLQVDAASIAPGDYIPAPAGTNLFGLYLDASYNSDFSSTISGTIPDSELVPMTATIRLGHYTEIGGIPWVFQTIIPMGGFANAKIGGVEQRTADGFGDAMVAATFWPINNANKVPYGTTVGLSLYVAGPTGSYETGLISLGTNSWAFIPQIGVVQNLGGRWFFDGALDATIPLDRTENGITYSRDPYWQLQTYIRYNVTDTAQLSFGYSGYFGGKAYVDGTYTGFQYRSDQLRMFANNWFTPSLQIQGMLGTDLDASGGFLQKLNAELRFIVLF